MDLPSTTLAPDGDNPSGGFKATRQVGYGRRPSRNKATSCSAHATWYLDRRANVPILRTRGPGEGHLGHELSRARDRATGTRLPRRPTNRCPRRSSFSGIRRSPTTHGASRAGQRTASLTMQGTMYIEGPTASTTQGLLPVVSPAGPARSPRGAPAGPQSIGGKRGTTFGSKANVFEQLGGRRSGDYHGASKGFLYPRTRSKDVLRPTGSVPAHRRSLRPTHVRNETSRRAGGRTQSLTQGGSTLGITVDATRQRSRAAARQQQENNWWQVDLGGREAAVGDVA